MNQLAIQHADPPGMAANGSGEASTAGQPGAEREEPMPDAEHGAGLHPPSAHVARTPPPWPTRRIAPAQARQERRLHGDHLLPARSQRPEKPHPTRPSVQAAGKGRPADTTATKTLSMPSWSPAGVTPTQSQRRRPCASARSRDATMQRAHPSGCHARHTSSATTPP